jgi:hypothetical protein
MRPLPGVNLKTNEKVLACVPNTTLMAPRSVRRYHAGSRGVSIRVMKGVSFRVGAMAGHSESHEVLRDIDVGTLILTSERLIFAGSVRTTNVQLADLLTVQLYSDAISVSHRRKEKPEFYALDCNQRLIGGSGQGLRIQHGVIKVAIEQAANNDSAPDDQFYGHAVIDIEAAEKRAEEAAEKIAKHFVGSLVAADRKAIDL